MHTGNLDVPSLVPSALGHRPQLSISSSSSGWSAVITDEEEGDPYVYAGSDYNSEMISLDIPSSKNASLNTGLSYTRRPSTTNHRSMVPQLTRHHSSTTSLSVSSVGGIPQCLPSPFYTEDDASSTCFSEDFIDDSERECTPSAAVSQRKRNRASLPAYFSLLQGSSTGSASPSSSPRPPRRVPSALQSLSRSLHASPTTPRAPHTAVIPSNESEGQDSERGRGRRRERDPDARSASSRRDIARSPPRHASRPAGLTATQRARIDSVEKVAEWVSSSPVMQYQHQHRKYAVKLADSHAHRRNSSPRPTKPKYDFAEALAKSLRGCALSDEDEEVEVKDGVRGRRRANELDEAMREDAPGIGSGRSGLRGRERGRAGVVRALGQH